jgi:trehalose utilization protein
MNAKMITLTAQNCSAKVISQRNNVVVDILYPDGLAQTIVMHKKYFNQISAFGETTGRLRETEDGLILFEGFSFK